jgi:O-antigen ligase
VLAAVGTSRVSDPIGWSLPVLLVVAGGVLVGAIARPVAVTVAAVSLYAAVRFEPAPSDLLVLCLVAGAALRGRIPTRVPPGIALLLVAFIATQFASMVNATDTTRAVTYVGITLYLVLGAAWLSGVVSDRRSARLATKGYVVAATLSALAAVAALKLHLPGGAPLVYLDSRAQGLFKDPNVFGPFLVPAAAIVLEEIQRPRLLGWSVRRLVLVLSVLIAGIVFAFSRAAWLNLAIACAFVVGFAIWRAGGLRVALRSTSALAMCGLAGFSLLAATGSLGFLSQRSKVETYDANRFANQAFAFDRATVHVLGYGPGQAEITLPLSTHSAYVRAIYEQGIPGLAVFVGLLLATLLMGLRAAYRDDDLHGIGSAALVGSFAGLLANGAFIDTIHWRHLWLIAALIWATSRSQSEPPVRGTAHSPPG